MSGHTEGPWNIAPRKGNYRAIPANAGERELLEAANAAAFEALSIGTRKGQVAIIPLDESSIENARLISAAPDLLAACVAHMDALANQVRDGKERPEYAEAIYKAQQLMTKAIARAKGESQ